MLRLIRLVKLLKVEEYLEALEDLLDVSLRSLRLIFLTVRMCFLGHIMACFWFGVRTFSVPEELLGTMQEATYVDGISSVPTWQATYASGAAASRKTTNEAGKALEGGGDALDDADDAMDDSSILAASVFVQTGESEHARQTKAKTSGGDRRHGPRRHGCAGAQERG